MINKIRIWFLCIREKIVYTKYISSLLDTHCCLHDYSDIDKLFYIEKAVRKTIPAKVISCYNEDDKYGIGIPKYYKCPSCKKIIYNTQNYCGKCGQRLSYYDI